MLFPILGVYAVFVVVVLLFAAHSVKAMARISLAHLQRTNDEFWLEQYSEFRVIENKTVTRASR
jgi:hypothetical protein